MCSTRGPNWPLQLKNMTCSTRGPNWGLQWKNVTWLMRGPRWTFICLDFPLIFSLWNYFCKDDLSFEVSIVFICPQAWQRKWGALNVWGDQTLFSCVDFSQVQIFKSKTLILVFAQRPGCNHSRWTLAGVMGATATNPGAFAAISRVRANPSADQGVCISRFSLVEYLFGDA